MTASEKLYHTQEFTQTYDRTESPVLPENLSHYGFVSCLADSDHKKTWILKKSNGQRVLCKYASGEYTEMLRTESEFFTHGKFPFVPYVYDYFETSDGAYLLREYIEGQTLGEIVEKEGPLPLEKAVVLIEQLCGHLSRFHAANPPIIYRDLKPSNIVLQPSGDCYLIDLGTVRTYHENNSADTVFIGTSETAAPEQFGARQTDARTDIYALGVLFYYLLTGELKIQESSLQKIPSKAAKIIRTCTAFDPNDRYPEVTMVVNALHDSVRSRIRRAAVPAAVCAVIFTLVVSGIVLLLAKSADSKEVVFASPLMEQAVRSAVGKAEGDPIYEKDLEQVVHLYICGDTVFHNPDDHVQHEQHHSIYGTSHGYGDVTDISLLQKMPNLHYVVLDYQQIYDISPLHDLDLISLSLCGNPITGIDALRDMKTLTKLYLSETGVSSPEALAGCSALTTLDCSYTAVNSVRFIDSLPIYSLYLTGAPVADYESFSELPLQELFLSHVEPKNYGYLTDIPTLHHLSMLDSNIVSLNDVAVFSHLSSLDVTGNLITDLNGLEQFTSLNALHLVGNPITDLSPLAKMGNLSFLGIATGTNIDFSFLNEMPQVQYISINSQQLPALYEAVPEPWFEMEVY